MLSASVCVPTKSPKNKRKVEGHCELEKVHKLSGWDAQRGTKERGSDKNDAFRTTANKLKMEDQQWGGWIGEWELSRVSEGD